MVLDRNLRKNLGIFFLCTTKENTPALVWLHPEVTKELLENGRRLGEGTFAVVYVISAGDSKVCAKIFKSKDYLPSMVEEAKALAALSGVPRVPTLFCVAENPVTLVTSFGGHPLEKLVLRKQLSRCQALDIGLQVAESVRLMHLRGWAHNDLKVDNVVVKKEGDRFSATIIDFGNAIRIGEVIFGRDRTGHISFPHIAPELFQGQAASSKSDVYSLGHLLASLIAKEDRNDELSFLIARAVTYDEEDRLSINALVQRLHEIHFTIFMDSLADMFSALKI
ncbi:tyrosine-protein kinase Fgr-like [Oratosquilla oratoria]|uniref:tyrosine-protein kinase Fgr-like n=1 Tax=Oratosquilla oratoria TaxID=337810 RepID=UPI003F76E253